MAFMIYDILGLSKEGWYIFKNLCTEVAILLCGYITFVPAIQVWIFSHLISVLYSVQSLFPFSPYSIVFP